MELSRQKLFKIDTNIPNKILIELAKFIQLDIQNDKLESDSIYKYQVLHYIEKEEYDYSSDLGDVAFFINYDLNLRWDSKSLILAYKHVISFYDEGKYKSIHHNFSYGPIIPSKYDNIDLLLVYGACVYFKIDALIKNDMSNIETLLRSFLSNSYYSLQKSVISKISHYDKHELFILEYNVKKINKNIDYNILNKLVYSSVDIPRTNYEAIVCAAINYQIDLTKKDKPLLLYKKMTSDPKFKNFCTSLRYKFNPKLSVFFYNIKTLKTNLLLMGYCDLELTNLSKIDLYQLCIESHLLSNFKHGFSENKILNLKTSIYQREVSSLFYHEVVRYGGIHGYIIYTYYELLNTFCAYNGFFKPNIPQELFTDRNIRKLSMLCSKKKRPDEYKYKYRMKLNKKINQILSISKTTTTSVKTLISFYKDNKTIVETVLKLFTYVAMSMRGWKGYGKYPIKDTLVNDQDAVNKLVLDKLKELILYINDNNIEHILLSLPLVGYTDGTFYDNNIPEKGITLGDRLSILENINNVNSCIRTTSNWFLSSIYKYSIILEIKPGFDIDKVRKIG